MVDYSNTMDGQKSRIAASGMQENKRKDDQSDYPFQNSRRGILTANYSFDEDGGAVGEIVLIKNTPVDMLIMRSGIECTEDMANAGAGTDIGIDGEVSGRVDG